MNVQKQGKEFDTFLNKNNIKLLITEQETNARASITLDFDTIDLLIEDLQRMKDLSKRIHVVKFTIENSEDETVWFKRLDGFLRYINLLAGNAYRKGLHHLVAKFKAQNFTLHNLKYNISSKKFVLLMPLEKEEYEFFVKYKDNYKSPGYSFKPGNFDYDTFEYSKYEFIQKVNDFEGEFYSDVQLILHANNQMVPFHHSLAFKGLKKYVSEEIYDEVKQLLEQQFRNDIDIDPIVMLSYGALLRG